MIAIVTLSKDSTGLVLIDPYNDFISPGGKVWDRLQDVIESNDCVGHMKQLLDAARISAFFMRCTVATALAITRLGNT